MKLLNNINLKLLALVAAVLLWFIVITVEYNIVKYPEPFEIQAINLSENFALAEKLPAAKIYVSLGSNDGKNLTQDIQLYVDLANLKPGEHIVPVQSKSADKNVEILKIEPAQVNVKISELAQKNVEIKLTTDGKPQAGYIVSKTEIEPLKATIKGAAPVIQQINSLEAKLTLTGLENNNYRINVPILAPQIAGNEIVTYEPSEVTVDVTIDSENIEKEVPVIAKYNTLNDQTAFENKITLSPDKIKIKGKREVLDKIASIETMPVEISTIIRTLTMQLKPNLPAGVELSDPNQTITATLNDKS